MIVTKPFRVYILAWLTALPALVLLAADAAAVTVCYPRDQMLSYISRDYQASKAANGIVRPFSIMEVWVSEDDGDWLIVTTDLEGNSCIVAYGEDFSSAAPAPVEQS